MATNPTTETNSGDSSIVVQKSESIEDTDQQITLDMPKALWKQLYIELRHSLKHDVNGWKNADIDGMEASALKKEIRRGPLQGKEEFTLSQEQLACCWQASCDFHEEIRNSQNVPAQSRCRHRKVVQSLVVVDETFRQI